MKFYLKMLWPIWLIDLLLITIPIMFFGWLFTFNSYWYYLIVVPLLAFVSYKGAKQSKSIIKGLICAILYIFLCRYLTPSILDVIFDVSSSSVQEYTNKDAYLGLLLSFFTVLPFASIFAVPASFLGKRNSLNKENHS